MFSGKDTKLTGFTNADWASQPDYHLVSGYTFMFGEDAVMWSLKKQAIVALSSMESEYIAQMYLIKELV